MGIELAQIGIYKVEKPYYWDINHVATVALCLKSCNGLSRD
jgi:hypothetical protein